MIRFQFSFAVLAVAGLLWRFSDPGGSYNTLFYISKLLAALFADNGFAKHTIGFIMVEQFVGVMFGAGLVSGLYLIVLGIRASVRLVFEHRIR